MESRPKNPELGDNPENVHQFQLRYTDRDKAALDKRVFCLLSFQDSLFCGYSLEVPQKETSNT